MGLIRRSLLAATCIAALAAAGCGSDDGGGATGSGSSGGEGGPLKLGLLVPLTGASAQSAHDVQNAVELGAKQVNEAGGIDGRDLVIESYDTELLPETAVQEAQRAITQDDVTALIGPWSTSSALAVGNVTERAQVVNVNYSAATPSVTEGKEFIFRTSPVTPDLAAGMVDVAEALGAKDVALLYDSGGFGLGAKGPITTAAKAAGITITKAVQYPINATDVTAQVSEIAQSDPGAVIIAGSTGADHGLVAKAMVEQGLDVPLIGFSPIVLPDAVKISAGAYEELPGVYTVQTADTTKDAYKQLLEQYNAEFEPVGNLPEQVLGAYDAVQLLAEALKKTGGAGGEELATALEQLPPHEGAAGAAGSTEEFGPDKHDALTGQYLVPYKMVGGKPTQDTALQLG